MTRKPTGRTRSMAALTLSAALALPLITGCQASDEQQRTAQDYDMQVARAADAEKRSAALQADLNDAEARIESLEERLAAQDAELAEARAAETEVRRVRAGQAAPATSVTPMNEDTAVESVVEGVEAIPDAAEEVLDDMAGADDPAMNKEEPVAAFPVIEDAEVEPVEVEPTTQPTTQPATPPAAAPSTQPTLAFPEVEAAEEPAAPPALNK